MDLHGVKSDFQREGIQKDLCHLIRESDRLISF